jgi:hypothetical protein
MHAAHQTTRGQHTTSYPCCEGMGAPFISYAMSTSPSLLSAFLIGIDAYRIHTPERFKFTSNSQGYVQR